MLPEGRVRSYLSSLKVVLAAESATLKMKARPAELHIPYRSTHSTVLGLAARLSTSTRTLGVLKQRLLAANGAWQHLPAHLKLRLSHHRRSFGRVSERVR